MTDMTFDTALSAFVAATRERIRARYVAEYPNLTPPTLVVERGRVYAKVIKADLSSRAVFCFVRIADGAILKAASWRAPAKHARGSIYVNCGQDAVSEYGANYIR